LFRVFNDDLEGYTGKFLLNKPGFTHQVKHFHLQPDECTIIRFDSGFYEVFKDRFSSRFKKFLRDQDVHSLIINATAESDYLHYRLYNYLHTGNIEKLLIESLAMDLIYSLFTGQSIASVPAISGKHKQLYLPSIEESRRFLQENFTENISLEQMAARACMSSYHFNRIFKRFTSISPYQYLLNYRLQHAAHLLKDTNESIATVSYLSGFNSPDHFSYAFKVCNQLSPVAFRKIPSLIPGSNAYRTKPL
jgi:AraC-like DNA-binding protein